MDRPFWRTSPEQSFKSAKNPFEPDPGKILHLRARQMHPSSFFFAAEAPVPKRSVAMRCSHDAFTLIDQFVVIAIFIALLVPAVQNRFLSESTALGN